MDVCGSVLSRRCSTSYTSYSTLSPLHSYFFAFWPPSLSLDTFPPPKSERISPSSPAHLDLPPLRVFAFQSPFLSLDSFPLPKYKKISSSSPAHLDLPPLRFFCFPATLPLLRHFSPSQIQKNLALISCLTSISRLPDFFAFWPPFLSFDSLVSPLSNPHMLPPGDPESQPRDIQAHISFFAQARRGAFLSFLPVDQFVFVFARSSHATICDISVFPHVPSADFFFRRGRLFFVRPRGRRSLRSRARARRWLVCAPRRTIPTRIFGLTASRYHYAPLSVEKPVSRKGKPRIPDMGAALVRTGAMCISRLMTYGASLAQMVQTTVNAYKRTKDI